MIAGSGGRQTRPTRGTVYIVGAGPGDPGLLTRRGASLLRSADVVVYDAMVHPDILNLARSSAERIYVGKRAAKPGTPQERINRILVDATLRASVVVRLKGGDPLVFGRGAEEALALNASAVRWQIVPGITAALGAAAYAGIPLTHRELASSFLIATGTEAGGALPEVPNPDPGRTMVFYMAVRRLGDLTQALLAKGWDPQTPAALVERATWPDQRVVSASISDLQERVSESGLRGPGVVFVGKVVALRQSVDWWERRPLSGTRIVVARSRAHTSYLVETLRDLGAQVSGFPVFESTLAPSRATFRKHIRTVQSYQTLLFTAPQGVTAFMSMLAEEGRDARALAGLRIICLGTATIGRAREYCLRPDIGLGTFDVDALLAAMDRSDATGLGRVLYATRPGLRSTLAEALRRSGANVEEVHAYDQVLRTEGIEEMKEALFHDTVDFLVFTSSSSVDSWMGVMGGSPVGRAVVAAIGPETRRTLDRAGFRVDLVPDSPTMDGLIRKLTEHGMDAAPSPEMTELIHSVGTGPCGSQAPSSRSRRAGT